MTIFKDYENYDALGLAELVKKKKVKPRELTEAAIDKVERYNPSLNAVIFKMFSEARNVTEQNLPEGPFTGVPFLLKDLLSRYAGVPFTKGSKACKNYIPSHDSEMVKRYRKAGVVFLGKTNTPEFGLMGVTEPELFGPTRNPWNLKHTPGGSSGGSGAAVGSGMVPMASAGDGGGSIRIPASCCGVFGLKPSRGRVPMGPDVGESWQGAAVGHVISRSVRDSAAMLDAVSGPDYGDPYSIAPPLRPYLEEVEKEPEQLKIAFSKRSPLGKELHPECVNAVEKAANLLQSLGHKVEEREPSIDGKAVAKCYFMLYYGEVAAEVADLKNILGREPVASDVETMTWILNLVGQVYNAGDFVAAMNEWNTFARQMGEFHKSYDLYLTPTLASLPVKVGELKPNFVEERMMKLISKLNMAKALVKSGMVDKMAIESLAKTPFTQLANLTGQPAMSVPMHWSSEGLPCGVQFIAPFGDESTLFRLAGQIERSQPWFNQRPILK